MPGAGGRDKAGRAVRAAELLPMNKAQGTPWGGENAQPPAPRSCGRRSRPSPAPPSPVRCSALPNPSPASPGAPQASPPEEGPHSLSTKGSTVPGPILPTAPPCTGPRSFPTPRSPPSTAERPVQAQPLLGARRGPLPGRPQPGRPPPRGTLGPRGAESTRHPGPPGRSPRPAPPPGAPHLTMPYAPSPMYCSCE